MADREPCEPGMLEALYRLARLRLPRSEACKAIRDIEALLGELRRIAPGGEPLYYVWETGQDLPEEPVRHEPRGRILIPGTRLDGEGRVELPWRGRTGGGKG